MPVRTWYALFAPPAAWFIALNAGYFLVDLACGNATAAAALHIAFAAMLLVSISAGLIGLLAWRRGRSDPPGESADPVERERFLLVVGTLGGVIFSVAILWFWVAAAVLDPCEPTPRSPFAPSAAALHAPAPTPKGGTMT